MSGPPAGLDLAGLGHRRLMDHELLDWTRSRRKLLERTDALLDRLERLNLRGEARASHELEQAASRLLRGGRTNTGSWSVQELLDGLFEAQQPILSELRACRLELRERSLPVF